VFMHAQRGMTTCSISPPLALGLLLVKCLVYEIMQSLDSNKLLLCECLYLHVLIEHAVSVCKACDLDLDWPAIRKWRYVPARRINSKYRECFKAHATKSLCHIRICYQVFENESLRVSRACYAVLALWA